MSFEEIVFIASVTIIFLRPADIKPVARKVFSAIRSWEKTKQRVYDEVFCAGNQEKDNAPAANAKLHLADVTTDPVSSQHIAFFTETGGKTTEILPQFSLQQHYHELRRRLIICIVAYICCFALCYSNISTLYHLILSPIREKNIDGSTINLLATGVTEGFFTQLHLATRAANILFAPLALWQLYNFCASGLYTVERWLASTALFCFICMAAAGVFFACRAALPWAWHFFSLFTPATNSLGDGGIRIILQPRISEYVTFALDIITLFIWVFQMPLAIIILNACGIVSRGSLLSWRRYFIVGAFIFGAIVTPPDVISQVVVAAFLLIMYEISLFACYLLAWRRGKIYVASPNKNARKQGS